MKESKRIKHAFKSYCENCFPQKILCIIGKKTNRLLHAPNQNAFIPLATKCTTLCLGIFLEMFKHDTEFYAARPQLVVFHTAYCLGLKLNLLAYFTTWKVSAALAFLSGSLSQTLGGLQTKWTLQLFLSIWSSPSAGGRTGKWNDNELCEDWTKLIIPWFSWHWSNFCWKTDFC